MLTSANFVLRLQPIRFRPISARPPRFQHNDLREPKRDLWVDLGLAPRPQFNEKTPKREERRKFAVGEGQKSENLGVRRRRGEGTPLAGHTLQQTRSMMELLKLRDAASSSSRGRRGESGSSQSPLLGIILLALCALGNLDIIPSAVVPASWRQLFPYSAHLVRQWIHFWRQSSVAFGYLTLFLRAPVSGSHLGVCLARGILEN